MNFSQARNHIAQATLLSFIASAVFVVPLLQVVPIVQGCDTCTFLLMWGSYGSSNGQFAEPNGVAVDSSGNVYVADAKNNDRVEKFDSSGNFILTWGSAGSGDGQFHDPVFVAVDSSDNVYVVDNGNGRVQKFDSSGNFLLSFDSPGFSNGQFKSAVGVAVDSSGNVYVTDKGNDHVLKFDSSGRFLLSWGSAGTGNGQFNEPGGVAVDSFGNVYVVDHLNSRVEKFTTSGAFLLKWGSAGFGDGQFDHPNGVAVDSSGDLYVTDSGNSRVEKFTSSGVFLLAWGSSGSGDGQFNVPFGVAVDSSGDVYVVDQGNARVEKFGDSASLITGVDAGSGTVSPNCPSGCSEAVGASISVTAIASSNYQFSSWTISGAPCSGGSSSNPCTFRMPNNGVTVSATFAQITQTLITAADAGEGSVSPSCPSPAGCQEPVGSSVTVTATPAASWQFSGWSTQTGIFCTSNPCTFTMPNNPVTLGATFTSITQTLIMQSLSTVVDSGQGTVAPNCPSPSGCSEGVGSSVTVTAVPSSGWEFSSWSTQAGVSCSSDPCTFTMPNDAVTLGATFTQIMQTLTTGVDAGSGSVSPSCSGGCSEGVGNFITVTATPSSGWQFSVWSTQAGVSCSDNPCAFTMPNTAVTMKATFIQLTQTLTTNVASGSGSLDPICPSGCSEVLGSSISVTATPASGWIFSTWTVTGASCSRGSTSNPCVFTMPNNAVTVSATFKSTTVTMSVSYSIIDGGSPTAPTFHYVLKAASKSLTLSTVPTAVSVDAGTGWSVTPNPLTDSSSSLRWYSTQKLTGTASSMTIQFVFQHQYYLTMKVIGPGSVKPSSNWYNAGQKVTVTATANSGHKFQSWTGTGTGSFTGTSNPATITMNSAITETAKFT